MAGGHFRVYLVYWGSCWGPVLVEVITGISNSEEFTKRGMGVNRRTSYYRRKRTLSARPFRAPHHPHRDCGIHYTRMAKHGLCHTGTSLEILKTSTLCAIFCSHGGILRLGPAHVLYRSVVVQQHWPEGTFASGRKTPELPEPVARGKSHILEEFRFLGK